jgi:O-antigen/teichoic acid export membrane protein
MVVLAKVLGPAEFGAFSLAYLVLLLANSLQTALVTQPHNVLASALTDRDYGDYTTSAAVGQTALAGVFTLLVLGGALVAPALGWNRGSLMIALAVAVPAWQLQEFARRALYTRGRIRGACLNDAVSYGGQFALILLLARRHDLTGPLALYIIAGTSALAALAGFWSIRSHLHGRVEVRSIRQSWAIGKWLTAATLANWLASQTYLVLTAGILGVYATGVFRALQNLIAPTQVIANAFQMVVTPRASRAHTVGGPGAVARLLGRGSIVLAIPLLLYFTLVGAFAGPIITFFYSPAYAGAATIVWPLGLAYLLSYVGRVLSMGLTASQDTKPIFWAQVASAAVTFSVGYLLVRSHGLTGSALGAIATQAVQVVLLTVFLRRPRRVPARRQAA